MKMPKHLFQKISDAINTRYQQAIENGLNPKEVYETGQFKNSETCKDLNRRLRWDAFWGWVPKEVHDEIRKEDLMDSHIDTALRNAMPEGMKGLVRRY